MWQTLWWQSTSYMLWYNEAHSNTLLSLFGGFCLYFYTENCQQPFTQTVTRAANIKCDYPDVYFKSGVQFFCRGENFTCNDILSTKGQRLNGKFRLTNTNRGFNVSISGVSSQDAGVYWCGVESKDGSYRVSVRQIKLEVEGAVGLLLIMYHIFKSIYQTN